MEFDVWRGLAIVGMVVFHIGFFLDFLGVIPVAYDRGGWLILARGVQWSFLLLVGIGMQLSYQRTLVERGTKADFLKKNIRRGAVVLGAALLVTVASGLVLPEGYIRFGILHLIGVSIIVLGFIVNYPRTALLLSVLIYVASFPVSMITVPESPPLMFGFRVEYFYTLDYFPVFPWMGIPAFGVWLGYHLLNNFTRHYPAPVFLESSWLAGNLAALGRRSLMIYLIHVPVIMALLVIWKKLIS